MLHTSLESMDVPDQDGLRATRSVGYYHSSVPEQEPEQDPKNAERANEIKRWKKQDTIARVAIVSTIEENVAAGLLSLVTLRQKCGIDRSCSNALRSMKLK